MELNAEEGVPQMAQTMYGVIHDMVTTYETAYKNDTYTMFYEKLTRSSEDFDANVAEMFDFLFDGLITQAQRQQIEREAKYVDLNRGRNNYSAHKKSHISDDACKERASEALQFIPEPLASEYN